jgi:hypothetical protein
VTDPVAVTLLAAAVLLLAYTIWRERRSARLPLQATEATS